ncbi:hypothetical protein H9P43_007924 [Blastocladiella emersonii ATCC 22665]|nr:hypothetical protein H9P43_007924 [Blastocladiella emersonii ATCC 22665]
MAPPKRKGGASKRPAKAPSAAQTKAQAKKAAKKGKAQHHAVPETEADVDLLSDEDLEFIEQNAQFASLVANLDVKALTKKEKKVKQPAYARTTDANRIESSDDESELDAALESAEIVDVSADDDSDADGESHSLSRRARAAKASAAAAAARDSDSDDDEIRQTIVEGESDSDAGGASGSDLESDDDASDAGSDAGAGLDSDEMDVDDIPTDYESTDDEAGLDDSAFLAPPPAESRYAAKHRKRETDDAEATYEAKPRAAPKPEKPGRLPVKLQDGRVMRVKGEENEEDLSLSTDDEAEDEEEDEKPAAAKPQRAASRDAHADLDDDAIHPLERIGQLSQRILDSPEDNIALLTRLLEYVQGGQRLKQLSGRGMDHRQVQKIALASLGQVYLDIIPGYRILELTDAQKQEKVGKEVRRLRNFEQSLLVGYQRYLSALDKLIKKVPKRTAIRDGDTAFLAMSMLCQLLVTHPHFNFRLNIINALVMRLTRREFRVPVLDTLRTVFKRDEEGSVSSEAARLIAKLVKMAAYEVDPEVVRVFNHLRLKHELTLEDLTKKGGKGSNGGKPDGGKLAKQKKGKRNNRTQYVNKKQRKNSKLTKEVLKELKEAEAVVDLEDRKKHHRITLEHVFLTYVRVLKTASTSRLVPAALEGLGIFAHLISVDYFQSLWSVFKSLLGDPALGAESKLSIIATANRVMSGQGEVLNLDLADFYTSCYRVLGELRMVPLPHDSPVLRQALDVLEEILRRKTSLAVVAGLFARVASLAASVDDPAATLACISVLAGIASKFPGLRRLLDPPSDRPTSQPHDPHADDPVLANALASAPFEFALLIAHWHPDVRAAAAAVAREMNPATAKGHFTRILGWRETLDKWAWNRGTRYVPDWTNPGGNAGRRAPGQRQQYNYAAREGLAKPGRRPREGEEEAPKDAAAEAKAAAVSRAAAALVPPKAKKRKTHDSAGAGKKRGGGGGGRGRGGKRR